MPLFILQIALPGHGFISDHIPLTYVGMTVAIVPVNAQE
jgi:hypothetical protein